MPTITRKIQLNFVYKDKKELNELYKRWRERQKIARQAANQVSTHLYIQDNIKTLVYLSEGVKAKLADEKNHETGILNTTQRNSPYKMLSSLYKGKTPTGMLSGISDVITASYNKEKDDVRKGNRSIRSYKSDIPMPVRNADIAKWTKLQDGNYTFRVYGTTFKTWFSRERKKNEKNNKFNRISNEEAFDLAMDGEYKLCDSSIQLDGKDIYLLAVFKIPKKELSLDPERIADCHLSLEFPIIIKEDKDKIFTIGTKDDFLHKRLQIIEGRRRAQRACKYNQSKHGYDKKFQAMEQFNTKEKRFVERKMHEYSKRLIDYCIIRNIGKIVLNNYQEIKDRTHEGTEEANFLLASWSYFSLGDKIKYKAAQHSIELEIN